MTTIKGDRAMEIGDRVKKNGKTYEVTASHHLEEVHPDRLRFEWLVGGGDADGIIARLDLVMDVVYEDMQSLPDAIDLQINLHHI